MNGSRIDTIEIQSRALEKTMAMKVYVPANGNEENHLNKGRHTIQYVKENLEKYLEFYSDDSA